MTLTTSQRSPGPATPSRYFSMRIEKIHASSMPDLPTIFKASRSISRATPRGTPTSSPVRVNTTPTHTSRRRGGVRGLQQPDSPRRATHPLASPSRRRRSNLWADLEVDPWAQFRRRVCTNPLPPGSPTIGGHRLRRFSVTTKGIVHLGDVVRNRSRSDIESSEGSGSDSSEPTSSTGSSSSSRRGSDPAQHRVVIVGGDRVGKASLVSHFLSSEYLSPYENYQDALDGNSDRSVSVLMQREETDLTFQCVPASEATLDDTTFSLTDAFLVVYSVTDRSSYDDAERTLALLQYLKTKLANHSMGPDSFPKALILVGNKADLARSRTVTEEEGRILASKYNIKFIETSAAIRHNVDELLVGIVSQIRLRSKETSYRSRRLSGKARGLMSKFLHKCELKVRSCDNLHVL
ncbi:GTP-binding protein REM 1-like [Limulus polyphemus]|uniref:GTP-binding protein REM 1-like n=1 Tax=Limulus polyphemus TaxID=6850 RepID=A0ABM1RXG8_LIMPO|nr:GTP-binding protein REM 1-like [Limulus polyphemus]